MPPTEPMLVERFEFQGFNGRNACCRLELMPASEGRTVVIATELIDNPGTSVTNVAEHLASFVCDRFGIDPARLVWIEHYGYPPPRGLRQERTHDLVSFRRTMAGNVKWSAAVLRHHPDGWPGYFEEPEWRTMTDQDWHALGISPRAAAAYAG